MPGQKRHPTKYPDAYYINYRKNEKRRAIDRLWREDMPGRWPAKSLAIDTGRYHKHLKPAFGDKEPYKIPTLDVEQLRRKLLKKIHSDHKIYAEPVVHLDKKLWCQKRCLPKGYPSM